jgi:hypothetical protein
MTNSIKSIAFIGLYKKKKEFLSMKKNQLLIILGILSASTAALGLILITDPPYIPPPPPTDQYVIQDKRMPDSHPVCKQEKIRVLAKLRKFCTSEVCNIDDFIKDAVDITEDDFLEIISGLPRTTFFYCKGEDRISQNQINQKAPEFISQLTTMLAYKDNSMTFILGKASSVGTQTDLKERQAFNKELSAQRTNNISYEIARKLREAGRVQICADTYKAYVGEQAFTFTNKVANQLYDDRDKAIFKRECGKDEKFEDYINQSVVAFAYPCLSEMCRYLKDVDGLSCTLNRQNSLPNECFKHVCQY